jgi:alpha-mannosidase
MHWQDDHRFLKARFDVDVRADHARHEIQLGHVLRPTTRNTTWEQARFEVAQHKYTDLSEPGYGIAFLNDCKYGISVDGGQVGLSLHKGGLRPDYTGDHGDHHVVYSFLPHPCGFSAEAVVRPAYQLNYHPVFAKGTLDLPQIAKIDKANIIIETIKPCEDAERALILRLYETEGTRTNALLTLSEGITTAYRANMLEEVQEPLTMIGHALPLSFPPFETQTIKICYYMYLCDPGSSETFVLQKECEKRSNRFHTPFFHFFKLRYSRIWVVASSTSSAGPTAKDD